MRATALARFTLLSEVIMKRIVATFSTLILLGFAAEVWSGPIEEVTQIAGPRLQALQDGNLDGYVAAFADNAVFQSSLSPFRAEGKEAIRAQLGELFQLYPKRRVLVRQPSMRAYGENLVIQNAYFVLYLTDQKGELVTVPGRTSVTWAKLGGRWQIVDQHSARLPVAP
jgi:uncharacterized protein (TIGR02246 family)